MRLAMKTAAWVLLLLCQQVSAQQDDSCANLRQLDMNECFAKRAESADRALNETYRFLLEHSDKERGQLLRGSQRAWIRFRDSNCKLHYDRTRVADTSLHGSMAGMYYAMCKERMSRERYKELDEIGVQN
jgi:uncharacterized protein YecT (DUF1311 family)